MAGFLYIEIMKWYLLFLFLIHGVVFSQSAKEFGLIIKGRSIEMDECNFDKDSRAQGQCYTIVIDSILYKNIGVELDVKDSIILYQYGNILDDYSHYSRYAVIGTEGIFFLDNGDLEYYYPKRETIRYNERYFHCLKSRGYVPKTIHYAQVSSTLFITRKELLKYIDDMIK